MLDQLAAANFETLVQVGAEVLETMFFTEAVAVQCSHEWLGSATGVGVRFAGTHRGEVFLSVSFEAAESMGAAFLGLDPTEVSETQRIEVMLELANIFCGAAMSRLWPEANLALETPRQVDAHAILEAGWHRCFTMPEGMLAITVRLGGSDKAAA